MKASHEVRTGDDVCHEPGNCRDGIRRRYMYKGEFKVTDFCVGYPVFTKSMRSAFDSFSRVLVAIQSAHDLGRSKNHQVSHPEKQIGNLERLAIAADIFELCGNVLRALEFIRCKFVPDIKSRVADTQLSANSTANGLKDRKISHIATDLHIPPSTTRSRLKGVKGYRRGHKTA